MPYIISQPYRHVPHLKASSPIYVATTIVQVHADHLVLSNGERIEFVPVDFGKERGSTNAQ